MMNRSNTLPMDEGHRSPKTKKALNRHSTSAARINLSKRTPILTSPPQTHSNPSHSIFHRHETTSTKTPPPPSSTRPSASSSTSLRPSLSQKRPAVPQRQNSVQTRYMSMLLALDNIPRLHNILASFFTWILLAGFVIFPGTFTSLSTSLESDSDTGEGIVKVLKSVKNIPLLAIAGTSSGVGAVGMCWLWWRWRTNYVWLLNRIFLPGTLNSLAGLISTLINVYTQQDSHWSTTAKITAIVTGTCMIITAALFAIYNFWILRKVRKSHGRDMDLANAEMGREEEGFLEKVERKAMKPALEPGSVV